MLAHAVRKCVAVNKPRTTWEKRVDLIRKATSGQLEVAFCLDRSSEQNTRFALTQSYRVENHLLGEIDVQPLVEPEDLLLFNNLVSWLNNVIIKLQAVRKSRILCVFANFFSIQMDKLNPEDLARYLAAPYHILAIR